MRSASFAGRYPVIIRRQDTVRTRSLKPCSVACLARIRHAARSGTGKKRRRIARSVKAVNGDTAKVTHGKSAGNRGDLTFSR
jgi:hypothetical protein